MTTNASRRTLPLMSRIKKEVQETAEDLHRAGLIDDRRLREFCNLTATCIACGRSGSLERFEGKAFEISCRKFVESVDALSGQQCRSCGEIFFDPESAERYAAAGDDLVRRN